LRTSVVPSRSHRGVGGRGTALGVASKSVCDPTPPFGAEPGSDRWGPRWGFRQNNQPGRVYAA
jgi:hypothetical protein